MSKQIFKAIFIVSLFGVLAVLASGLIPGIFRPMPVSAQESQEENNFKDIVVKGIQSGRWRLPEDSLPDIQWVQIAEPWAVAFVYFIDPNTGIPLQMAPGIIPGHKSNNEWRVYFPAETDYNSIIIQIPRSLLPDSFLIPLGIQRDNITVQEARNAGKLPWACNQSRRVLQDRQNAGNSHYPGGSDQWAWDFAFSTDEAVLASRSGVVAHIYTATPKNTGCLTCTWTSANRVVIDHGDGTATLYMHLSDKTPPVTEGQSVSAGDVIGYADHTGKSSGTHLHFALQPWNSSLNGKVTGILWYQSSIESLFDDPNVAGGNPIFSSKTPYKSGNCGANSGPKVELFSQNDYQPVPPVPPAFSGGIVSGEQTFYDNLNGNYYSMRIPPNWSVKTWRGTNRTGDMRCWWESQPKLQDNGWQDQSIRSLEVFDQNVCPQVELFSKINFDLSIFKKGPVGPYNEPNADALSMKIPDGWSVKTWRGDNRTGEERCWWESQPKLQDHGWDRAIQSIEIYDHDVCPKPIFLDLTTGLNRQINVEVVVTKVGDLLSRLYYNTLTTNSQGNITGLQLPDSIKPGQYDIYVKPLYYLRQKKSGVSLQTGTNLIQFSSFKKLDIAQNDNKINVMELMLILQNWGATGSIADLDGDGAVGINDLMMVLSNWGSRGEGWTDTGPWGTSVSGMNIGAQDIQAMSTLPTLANGDFELGANGDWTESSSTYGGQGSLIVNSGFSVTPRSDNWLAWLGLADDEISDLSQTITLPPASPIYLHYWYQIDSQETVCSYDIATIRINSTQVQQYDLCSSNNTSGEWILGTLDLSAYAGQTVTIHFHVETDSSISSNFFVDDVSFADTSEAPGRIILTPATGILNVGDTINMQARLDTGSYSADGADLILRYDPGVLEVQDASPTDEGIQINPGSIYSEIRENVADPSLGEIRFSADEGTFRGNQPLATITFTVVSAINNTSVEVYYSNNWTAETNIVKSATISDVLRQANTASFQTVGVPSRVMPTMSLTPTTNAKLNTSLVELEAVTTEPYTQVEEVKFEANLSGTWTTIGFDTYQPNGWKLDWDTSSVPDGYYDLRATAFLHGGNGTTITNTHILLDRVPPTYAFAAFSPSSVISASEPITIEVAAFDEGSGVDHIDIYANMANDGSANGEWNLVGSISGSQGNLFWNTSNYSAGTHLVNFDIYDKAGNQGPDPQPHLLIEIQGGGESKTYLPVILKNK